MAKWQNGKMAKWQNGKMAKWQNGKQQNTKHQNVKRQNVKIQFADLRMYIESPPNLGNQTYWAITLHLQWAPNPCRGALSLPVAVRWGK
jgi:hypothetical protein